MFIHNPDSFLLPTYRISPFTTNDIKRNSLISSSFSNVAIDYFNTRFGPGNWVITSNGREAIAMALSALEVKRTNQVSIITPSQNLYISSCVTSTIEQFCSWNRQNTGDIVFVNHEFGYLQENIQELSLLNVPLIEDCCTTFFSQDAQNNIGRYGAYSVFSFPKFFSIQIGGLLVGENVVSNHKMVRKSSVTYDEQNYILKVVGFELSKLGEILEKRKTLHEYASARFGELGFTLRFSNRPGLVPSVLLLNNNGIIKDLQRHKDLLNRHGIQNSVFYGEDAFFIPCHQNLSEVDVDYFKFVTENFLNS